MTTQEETIEIKRVCANCLWCVLLGDYGYYTCQNATVPVVAIPIDDVRVFGCNKWEDK